MRQGSHSFRPVLGPLKLNATTIARALSMATIVAASVQVLLGADWLPLSVATAMGLGGLATFARAGALNVGAWIVFFYVFGNVLVALWAKSSLGQTLESHLYDPVRAFLTVAAGGVSLILAFAVARAVPVGRPVFRSCTDPGRLRVLSWGSFVLGVTAWYLHSEFFVDASGLRFGGFALFKNLLLMSVIARTAMLLESSGGTHSIDATSCLILLCCVFFGLVDNSKAAVALPFVSYYLTGLFYRKQISPGAVGTLTVGVLAFVLVVGPMVHIYRGLGIQDVPIAERIELLERSLLSVAEETQAPWRRKAEREEVVSYYNYFGGGFGQTLLGRYASVQQVDPVVAEVAEQGPLGSTVVFPSLLGQLPRFLYPDKPEYGEGYWIVARLGVIDPEGGKYPTVPLVAQAYAGYGALGVATIPFAVFSVLFLLLKKLGWSLDRNVYAIFFLCQFVVVYASQGDLGQYAGAILRGFPSCALVFVLLSQRFRRRSAASHTVAKAAV